MRSVSPEAEANALDVLDDQGIGSGVVNLWVKTTLIG